ncbi:hypothetical protein XENORESO_010640 [Xenotaenia resolanae]|uniref:Uncharacterized protein n=1 Tax=Xenotaenia resolanae TaxID=208358 RepID=A0ABV0VPF7_9TELE
MGKKSKTLMVVAPSVASSRRERQLSRLSLSQFSSLEYEREHIQLVTVEGQPVAMSRRETGLNIERQDQVRHLLKVSIKLLAAAAWPMQQPCQMSSRKRKKQ